MIEFKNFENTIDNWFRNIDLQTKRLRLKKILEYLSVIDKEHSISTKIGEENDGLLNAINEIKESNNAKRKLIRNFETYISEKEDILIEQEEISAKHSELAAKKQEIERLESKKNEINEPENKTEILEKEISQINGRINEKLGSYIQQLETLNKILKGSGSTNEIENRTRELINEVNGNIDAIAKRQYNTIQKLSAEPVETIYKNFNKKINELTQDYNNWVNEVKEKESEWKKIEEEKGEKVKQLKEYLKANKKVLEYLTTDNATSVNDKIKEIEKYLNDLDNTIKTLRENRKNTPLDKII